MKNIIIFLAIMFAIACFVFGRTENVTTYPETGKVVNVSDADLVTVEISDGNLFEFYGGGWKVGDCASLEIDGCGTETIRDDVVINAQYSAWKIN